VFAVLANMLMRPLRGFRGKIRLVWTQTLSIRNDCRCRFIKSDHFIKVCGLLQISRFSAKQSAWLLAELLRREV